MMDFALIIAGCFCILSAIVYGMAEDYFDL